jgi:hypothetical protein
LTATLTTPLTTVAEGLGKIHSPELFAVGRIEESFAGQAGTVSSTIFIALFAGVVLVTAAAWARPKVATIAALALAAGCMGVVSLGAYAFDSTNTKSVRQAFSGSNPSWVDDLHLGRVHLVLTPNGLSTDALEQMFWNRSVDRAVLLAGAKRPDALPVDKGVVAADGTLLVDGHPLTTPALINEYASSVQVRGATRLGSGPTSVLYRPKGALRLRLLAIGQFDLGWLGERGALVVWPDAKGGQVAGRIVLRLSLPAGAATVRMRFRDPSGTARDLEVRAGTSQVVSLPACGTGPVELLFAATSSGRLGDTRVVSVRSKPPTFTSDPKACPVGSSS